MLPFSMILNDRMPLVDVEYLRNGTR